MRCDICGSGDSIFFIRPDGYGGELRMCRACALARGFASGDASADTSGMSSAVASGDVSGGGGNSPGPEHARDDASAQQKTTCPDCGWTQTLIRSSGRLGCAGCVTVFRREIYSAIQRAGGRVPYDGKVPGAGRDVDCSSLASLSSSLELAIASEDFEAAAAIRDRIRAISVRLEP